MNPSSASPANPNNPQPPHGAIPPVQMLDLIMGYWVSRALFCVAKLGIAELIGDGAKSAEELAGATRSNAGALYRVLRALASKGVFAEKGGKFSLTPLGTTLRAGVPGSMRNFALMMVDDYNWEAWRELGYGIETGKIAFDRVHGVPAFEFLGKHPEQAKIFGESMGDLSAVESPAIAEAYDFSRFTKIVDIGGGHGALLAEILEAQSALEGLLFDDPQVIANAKKDAHINDPAVRGRVETASGSFFESVPAGADAYAMKYILHDWADEKSLQILRNVRKEIPATGTLLVFDTVVPEAGAENTWSKWLDINMLVIVGGKERTEREFAELFAKAGFLLTRVVATKSMLSIVEGRPA